ncbi:hypothetical protein ACEPPN_005848 [Leptodophora sp. 'Broadleaf-Isolate-01']
MPRPMQYPIVNPFSPRHTHAARHPIPLWEPDDPYEIRHSLPRMPMPTANPFGRPPFNPAADAAYQAGRRDAFAETLSAAEDAAYRAGRKDAEDERECMRTAGPPPYRPYENERGRRRYNEGW